jgi:hypothetical protein
MADASGLRVCDLLPARLDRLDARLKREQAGNAALAKSDLGGMALGVVGEKADEAIRGVLGIDLFGVLAQAWAKARELHEYADVAKHPPDEISTVFLGDHALTAALHPSVDVSVGPARFTLEFSLELEAQLRLAQLTIKAGHIAEVGKCDGQASAVLKYDGVALHDPLKSRRVTLAGPLTLAAPGVPIA